MSTRLPPDRPDESESSDEPTYEPSLSDLKDARNELRELFRRESEVSQTVASLLNEPYIREQLREELTKKAIPGWVTTALQGITLATIVGCAFWLGTLSATVSRSAEKIDKLNDAVIGVGKDGLSNRLSVIETKLDAIDRKIDQPAPR